MQLTDFVVLSLVLILTLIVVILGMFVRSVILREFRQKDSLIQQLMTENRDLLNRLKSSDLATYQTMTHLTNSQNSNGASTSDPYYGQDDASVLARLSGLSGVGEPLYDDQTEYDPDLAMLLQSGGYVVKEPGN